MNQYWTRLSQVISWTGLSTNRFAIEIGLNRAEVLYNIKRGKHRLSKDIAEYIVRRYDNINKEWLLTGEGEMFFNEKTKTFNSFPYYAKDVSDCLSGDKNIAPDAFFTLPLYRGSDFAAMNMSDAMCPDMPMGSVLVFQEVELQEVIYGKSYCVVSDDFILVRNIRLSKDENSFDLEAVNSKQYDVMSIEKSKVLKLYLIKGVIIDKTK
ncbi:MAG: hypothetical protein R3Y38_01300 [Rikenellaceae bacterium]